MRSRGTATVILTLGLVGVGLAAFLASLSATALSEPALAATAPSMLDATRVRSPIRLRTADALVVTVPGVAALDPQTRGRLTESVLDEPSFVVGFAGVLSSVHDRMFRGERDPILIDPAVVRSATDAALADVAPDVGVVPPDSLPVVVIDTESIPRLDGWDRVVRIGALLVGSASLIAIGFGIALARPRLTAIGRLGRWCVGIGLAVFVVFWLAPSVVAPFLGGWVEVGGIALAGNGALLVPALIAIAAGVGVIYVADRLRKLQRDSALSAVPRSPSRRVTDAERRTA